MLISNISFVICSYNGSSTIVKVLDSILNQAKSSDVVYEVLLIDNNSSDCVSNVFLEYFKDVNVESRVVLEEKQGLMFARHRGLREAKYDLVTFIDDDNYIGPNWCDFISNAFVETPSMGALGGKGILFESSQSPQWLAEVERAFALGPQGKEINIGCVELQKVKSLYGAGLTIRKSVLMSFFDSGYNNLLQGRTGSDSSSGEDSEICELIKIAGYSCCSTESLYFYHDIPNSRFEKKYVINLFKSFGIAFITLLPLRFMTDYKIVPKFISRNKIVIKLILTFYKMYLYIRGVVSNSFKNDCKKAMVDSAIKHIDSIDESFKTFTIDVESNLKHVLKSNSINVNR